MDCSDAKDCGRRRSFEESGNAVGDAADVAPYRGAKTRIIDARGHAATPGLVGPTVRELNEAAMTV